MNSADKAKAPVTGFLVVPNISESVKFFSDVFGGSEKERYQAPNGKTWYSVMDVAGSPMHLMEQFPSMGLYSPKYRPEAGGDTFMVAISVKDVDATYAQAIKMGATSILAPHDAYWGDRYAEFRDAVTGVRYAACDESSASSSSASERTEAEQQVAFADFQKKNNFPTSPAKIVGVNVAAIVDAMPTVHLAFGANETALTDESRQELAVVADYLEENPDKKIVIIGHADSVGAPESELNKLSVARAESVAAELVKKYNIKTGRVQTQGVGSLSPVATNSTPEGRARNRRVVFVEA
jgi:outer membrane protein OmpA-like peptidoglycan-associated protein